MFICFNYCNTNIFKKHFDIYNDYTRDNNNFIALKYTQKKSVMSINF